MKLWMLLLFGLASVFLWAVPPDSSFVYTHGGDFDYAGKCLAVDDSGYVYVGGEISNESDSNCFLLVLKPDLQPTGALDFGGIGYDRVNSLVLDTNNSCLLTGEFRDSLSFGSYTLQSDSDGSIYLALASSNGKWIGALRPYGDNTDVNSPVLALDGSNSIFLAGSFDGFLNFGGDWLESRRSMDIFLVKMDSTAAQLWAVQVGGPGVEMAEDIRVDSQGNCYLAGFFNESVSFGNTVLTSKGEDDAFLAKLDKDGNWVWVKQFGATESDYARSVALDKDDNCYLITESSGLTTLGGKTYDHALSGGMMLHKLDPKGNLLWTRQARLGMSTGLAVNTKGDIYITGRYYGEGSFGDKKIKSNGSEDIYFLKLDPQGNALWLESTGGQYSDISNDLVLDRQGNCYVTGTYSGKVTFGPYERTSNHPDSLISDLFIYKISADK